MEPIDLKILETDLALALAAGRGFVWHPELGDILLTVKANARRYIVRWDSRQRVQLTVPPTATVASTFCAIEELCPRLLARRRTPVSFTPSQVISVPGLEIRIEQRRQYRSGVGISSGDGTAVVTVSDDLDFDDEHTADLINTGLLRIAKHQAERLLLPRARELAKCVGAKVKGWGISSGRRTFGTCSRGGVIRLSSVCVFLPQHLRDYIVFHELAHLWSFDHSPEFHRICDAFCGGRERALERELAAFPWPILR